MRRIPAALAVVGLSVLTLVGCASASPSAAACHRGADPSGVLDTVSVSGAEGTPEVTLSAPVYVDHTVAVDETVGSGQRVTSDMQDVQFAITIMSGSTGQKILTSGTQVTPLSKWREQYAGFADMMMCATEGSRIVGAVPASDLSDAAAQGWGLSGSDAIVVAIDLQKVYLAAADGVPQYNDRRGMPSVVLAPDGTPGVIIPDTAPPTDLAVEVLKKGDGPAVGGTDSIRINYTGVTWADRKVFDSTWENGASAAVTLDAVVPGFAQALDGQTVGSQILVVIPPALGYGDTASGSIPAGSTLVFVIDILGVDTPATS
ncbi:FKBP-type peptidyl-prolyl cis-trans isomerase [Microbacterium hominis]|uniref:FKBP-type peptidyl-prolyl cis-trans isomerase n=1 Tax=Microbacterium hominis TaxID=162426 RepID=UPI00077CB3EC|nr:FKBP-type peptidyl-prolyl cis-trans isomerase [Microbacterium hominis]